MRFPFPCFPGPTRHVSLKNVGFSMVFEGFCVFWCVDGAWSVCLACCRRFFVSWRPSRGFQRRFGGLWRPFRRPKSFKKPLKKPKAAQSKRQHSRPYPGNAAQRRANMSSAEQGTAEQGNAQQSTASQRTAQHSIAHNAEASRQAALRKGKERK